MFSEFLKSGTYVFPTPTKYGVDYEDIDSKGSTRNEAAYMHRKRLRSDVVKIRVTWKLTAAELAVVAPKLAQETFTLTFFNSTTAQYKTITAYCSRKSSELLVNDATASQQYWQYDANIVEC